MGIENVESERKGEIEYMAEAHAGFFGSGLKGFSQSQSLRPNLSRYWRPMWVKYGFNESRPWLSCDVCYLMRVMSKRIANVAEGGYKMRLDQFEGTCGMSTSSSGV